MRSLSRLFCCLLLLTSCSFQERRISGAPTGLARYAPAMRSTVRIEVWCDSGLAPGEKMPVSLGSGVAIRADIIVTAAHVVVVNPVACQHQEFRVVREDGEVFIGVPGAFAPQDYDIATLKVPAVFTPAEVGPEPAVGDEVCGYGWDAPDGWENGKIWYLERPPFKCGVVTSNLAGIVMSGFHAVHGNSGSGWWDVQGRVVAVVSQGDADASRDFWVRGPVILPLLDDLLK